MKPGSTARTELKRLSHKASDSQEDLYSILDDTFVAHVGVIDNGLPLVIPMAHGRSGNRLYLHGSTGSRLMRLMAANPDVCVSITELNALKIARSTFNTGMHYRSAVIFGKANLVPDEEKLYALDTLSNSLIPGRVEEARPTTKKELAATIIIWLELNETSVKISTNEVDDPEEDMNLGYWAGILPLKTVALEPIPADEEASSLPVPRSVRRLIERYSEKR